VIDLLDDAMSSHDGRITNGGKGTAYLRDFFIPGILSDQLSEGEPAAAY
jgi:hypothetical protein